MVQNQIAARGIKDENVLEAMRAVPRHAFIPPEYDYAAYTDGPLPIGWDQTISQPYIVALMTELLELKGKEKVLEVGTGSGYQAAVLAMLAEEVHTIERFPELSHKAEQNLKRAGYENVHIHIGDGSRGLKQHAPYDGIIVTAAAPAAPQSLLDQLKDEGKLVIPVGSRGEQYLERWHRVGDEFDCERILPVAFVPLIGDEGWRDY